MKTQYQTPEMEIRWFESENICLISEEGYIPETETEDAFDW